MVDLNQLMKLGQEASAEHARITANLITEVAKLLKEGEPGAD